MFTLLKGNVIKKTTEVLPQKGEKWLNTLCVNEIMILIVAHFESLI